MDGLREYLKQRGFDDEIIKEWKLEPDTNEVLINYLDPEGNLLYTRRNRPGKEPKYISPSSERMPGGHSYLYGLHMLKHITDKLLIIEGEYNCIASWIMGHYALGVAGQTMSLKDYQLKDIPDTVKKIIILYDDVKFATERAREILKYFDHNIKVYIAKYPDKRDANDYYKEGLIIDFKAIINTADRYMEDQLKSSDIAVKIPENDFVEAYKEYAIQITDAPEKYQELMALSILATVLGRQIFREWGRYNLYPNLYVVLIGKSTVMRKSDCLDLAKYFVEKVTPEKILPEEFTPEGLFDLLTENSQGLITFDEFGGFLASAGKSYQTGIKEFITRAYNSPNKLPRRLKNDLYVIENICLNIATGTTIDWLIDRITQSDTMGGFLGRFVFIPCTRDDCLNWYPEPQKPNMELEAELIDNLTQISTITGVMELSDEAKTIWYWWSRSHDDEMGTLDNSKGIEGFFGRLAGYVQKFAMLYEISGNRTLTISEGSLMRAIKLVNWLKQKLYELMEDQISFTKEDREIQKVFNLIKTSPNGSIRRDKLLNNSHMTAKQLNEIITTLIQSSRINGFDIVEGQRRARAYKLI